MRCPKMGKIVQRWILAKTLAYRRLLMSDGWQVRLGKCIGDQGDIRICIPTLITEPLGFPSDRKETKMVAERGSKTQNCQY